MLAFGVLWCYLIRVAVHGGFVFVGPPALWREQYRIRTTERVIIIIVRKQTVSFLEDIQNSRVVLRSTCIVEKKKNIPS